MKYFLVGSVFISWVAFADGVCVRNYPVEGGPCQAFPTSYAFVAPLETEAEPLCTRSYPPGYCGTVKEYEWVKTQDGGKICTVNYEQKPVSDLCNTTPQFYAYALSVTP